MTPAPVGSSPLLVPSDRAELEREKLRWVREGIEDHMVSNAELLARTSELDRVQAAPLLRRKPSRTLSGVAIVAVMTAPAACPHGKCTYCPGGLDNRSPQSYTGEEPSALRGAQLHYDARAITSHRLSSLESVGHSTSKVEVILMGGTFPSRPSAYRRDVFRGVFEGLNGMPSTTLEGAQKVNETSARRCVSLTVETRPDWCDGKILPELLDAGVTRVEIGVECLTDAVLWATGRAHGTEEIRRATREARDRGLKVCYHWMLGLPGMDPERDLADFPENVLRLRLHGHVEDLSNARRPRGPHSTTTGKRVAMLLMGPIPPPTCWRARRLSCLPMFGSSGSNGTSLRD